MDEASERGCAGEIDLGVGHTEVSARDGSGEPLRGMTEKAKRRKPRTSATQAPSSHTRTPPLLSLRFLVPATVSARSSHHSDLPVR